MIDLSGLPAGAWCARTCKASVTDVGADCECGGAARLHRMVGNQLRVSGFRFIPPIIGIVPPLGR